MKKFLAVAAAISMMAAIFVSTPILAKDQCAEETQERVLKDALEKWPDLLVVVLEGNDLQEFWNNLKKNKLLLGDFIVDKLYIFKSDTHPDAVYVFFLMDGCIVDVKMTSRNLINQMLEGIV